MKLEQKANSGLQSQEFHKGLWVVLGTPGGPMYDYHRTNGMADYRFPKIHGLGQYFFYDFEGPLA